MSTIKIGRAGGWLKQASPPWYEGANPLIYRSAGTSGTLKAFNIALSGAGRFSFYVDYSERSTAGDHTFYVQRTHGTTGPVSVDYATAGDTHTTETGTLSWADGEADIKSIVVNVASKTVAGDHRMYMQLSNPVGGAVLHHGTNTIAYGVIDDGTIALDADAVFYDSAATGGTGTQADPYDSIYTAIANVGSKRYIYGKGTTVIDGTNTVATGGGGTAECIDLPATRTSEATRVYIRNWPGFTWAVQGDGASTNQAGFYANSGESFQTLRGIDFSILDTSGETFTQGWGIFYHYGSSTDITIEHCTADDINGASGANNGAYMLWGTVGAKVWRCTSNNIQTAADNTNLNTAAVFTYDGENISVQRCAFTLSSSGIYHKRVASGTAVSTGASFCHMETDYGIHLGASGSTGRGHNYCLAQSNLFEGCSDGGIEHILGGGVPTTTSVQGIYATNNVLDSCGSGEGAAIHERRSFDNVFYNNIFLSCAKVWADDVNYSGEGTAVRYANYNLEHLTVSTTQPYEYLGTNYTSAANLFSATGFAENDNQADPLFTNAATDDYTLGGGSPGLTGGVDGSEQGIYFTGIEVIGA